MTTPRLAQMVDLQEQPSGAQGPQGAQGVQGAQGFQGATGQAGLTGPQGATGAKGVNWRGLWDAGTAYAQGDGTTYAGNGYVALTSSTNRQPNINPSFWEQFASAGLQGPQGSIGNQGSQGSVGAAGPTGLQGAQGFQGATGAGTQGVQGTQGATGSQGVQGFQGTQGTQGRQGFQGFQGSSGGAQGAQGPQGFQGASGGGGGSGIAAWQPTTAYTAGSWLSHDPGDGKGSFIYQVTTNFTSGSTFSTANLLQGAVRPGDVHATGSLVFSQPGSASITTSGSWIAPASGTVVRCYLDCNTAPSGSNLVVQFRKSTDNGATWTTLITLTINAGSNAPVSGVPSSGQAYNAGDLFDANATSVGSGTAATEVTAQFNYDQVIA